MKTKVLIIIIAFASSMAFGQKKLADKFFENYGYIKASELYEIAVKKGDSSKHVLTRLGDCYWNNSNSKQASKWFNKAVNKYSNIDLEYVYKYIQTQLSIGDFEEAGKWIDIYKERNSTLPEDIESYIVLGELSTYKELSSMKKVFVDIDNIDLNSKYSDFGSYIHKNKMYFASSRNTSGDIYEWTQEPFLDIYVADLNAEGELSQPLLITDKAINTNYHEASIAITNNDSTLYFTRDNLNRRERLNPDKAGTTHLKIYKAIKEEGTWVNIEELPFNSKTASTGHPTLSPDNKKLYFVSDREGGLGETDIYYVDINEDGTYGEPQNLGPAVNTLGREMFPFVAKDNTLYFSSDGNVNLGLLDIYKSDFLKNGSTEVENLAAPFNSGYDDFAFYINEDGETGYFTSNRDGGKGNDDIYSFKRYECEQIVKGIVKNSDTKDPIPGATVQKIDSNGKVIEEFTSDENGEFSFNVECDDSYTILGKKTDYKDDFKNITTDKEDNKEHFVELNLVPLIKDDQIVINPIFFDFDKWNIRTDAQYELENIVDVLREHPNMVIKIESHTDSRGSDKYNMKLSDRRAKSTRDYLLSREIEASRIESAIGYGESQLLNKCSNGVKCSKEEHQLNRRSYFYIVKY